MATKTIHQLVDQTGTATAPARSAPDWFVNNASDPQVEGASKVAPGGANLQWGPIFSSPQGGNAVEFFTTGEDYFKDVAAAISGARSSVFIAGWQVNYDVELVGGKTLLHCLQDALSGGATVYVMPWLSPKIGVDTGDFETTLAVYHLNAGRNGARAYCLPAMQQGDQGTLGVFFAHHQKLVVIDNQSAYVGGIDLAYGRRDNGNFTLKAEGRSLNELYNSCVPAIHRLSLVEQRRCVTRAELLAAGLTSGFVRDVTTFILSPSDRLAGTRDGISTVTGALGDAVGSMADWWNNINLLTDFLAPLQDAAVDAAQDMSQWAWDRLDPNVRGRLGKLRDSAGANASDAAVAVLAWLHNADLSQLPPPLITAVSLTLQSLTFGAAMGVQGQIDRMNERYEPLFRNVKVVPLSGNTPDPEVQPRMPWHDVHCRIQGPSVFDLANNFVRRWNSTASSYEKSTARLRDPLATWLLKMAGIVVPAVPRVPRVQAAHLPVRNVAKKGSNRVQVLRSAPRQLLLDEAAASGDKQLPAHAQNNCLKAMLKAIGAAQKFIYIEGQFFQSAYGRDEVPDPAASGPMGALLDIRRSPGYDKFAEMLQIRNVPIQEIPRRMRWAKIDEVNKEAHGPEFMSDLRRAFTNLATIEFMRLMAKPQDRLKNPIGKALVNRIERAINDGVPFHVYMVLPVHPEGTLDTLNIMTQVHLTMQSLVFGEDSLVNGVRRAVLAARYRKERKMDAVAAEKAVRALDIEKLEKEVGEGWKQYLTLLNLRNWDTIGGKPVTEQIYVHSKLLIADDRVAILGSANINDRSQWGDRDSELAVIVTDDTPIMVKLDGVNTEPVGASVHKLRRALWEKLFGLKSRNRAATTLASAAILDSPAAPATWTAIQQRAQKNADAYNDAFLYTPRSGAADVIQKKESRDSRPGPPPSSIWPTWQYVTYLDHGKGGHLQYRMPFDPLFWRMAERSDAVNSWNVAKGASLQMAPASTPENVGGFISALPTDWTFRENNQSGMNLSVLADNGDESGSETTTARVASQTQTAGESPGTET